jgi:hypothetical protein
MTYLLIVDLYEGAVHRHLVLLALPHSAEGGQKDIEDEAHVILMRPSYGTGVHVSAPAASRGGG